MSTVNTHSRPLRPRRPSLQDRSQRRSRTPLAEAEPNAGNETASILLLSSLSLILFSLFVYLNTIRVTDPLRALEVKQSVAAHFKPRSLLWWIYSPSSEQALPGSLRVPSPKLLEKLLSLGFVVQSNGSLRAPDTDLFIHGEELNAKHLPLFEALALAAKDEPLVIRLTRPQTELSIALAQGGTLKRFFLDRGSLSVGVEAGVGREAFLLFGGSVDEAHP